jgi:hypothetical protein
MKMTSNLLTNTFPLKNNLYVDTNNGKSNSITEKVLYKDKSTREVLLMNQQGIVTNYTTIAKNNEYPFNDGIAEVEKAIQQGESFESAFRRRGFIIRKNILHVYTTSLRSWLRKEFGTTENYAKAKCVEFIIKRGEMIRNYAVITEVYSPDLHKAEVTEKDHLQINFSFTSLQAAGFSKQEIWQIMDQECLSWLTPVRFEYI